MYKSRASIKIAAQAGVTGVSDVTVVVAKLHSMTAFCGDLRRVV